MKSHSPIPFSPIQDANVSPQTKGLCRHLDAVHRIGLLRISIMKSRRTMHYLARLFGRMAVGKVYSKMDLFAEFARYENANGF